MIVTIDIAGKEDSIKEMILNNVAMSESLDVKNVNDITEDMINRFCKKYLFAKIETFEESEAVKSFITNRRKRK